MGMCECQCQERIKEGIMKNMPEITEIHFPIELLSNRYYLELEKVEIKNGKPKRSKIPLLLSMCPFCGEDWRGEDEKVS